MLPIYHFAQIKSIAKRKMRFPICGGLYELDFPVCFWYDMIRKGGREKEKCRFRSSETISPECGWTPSSTPRTRHCSVRTASAWTPRSTVPPGASCCGSAWRLADARREMQSSRGDTGCPVNTSFTPSGRIGWTDGTANRISLLPATARRLRLPEGGIAVPSRFRS